MKLLVRLLFFFLLLNPQWALANPQPVAYLLDIDGAIGPASSDYFERGLARAQAENAEVLILRLDTPGGLDTSMRKINKAILSSKIPVITFIAPEGARAASAGTYILYASHIAAMAPATNLGAATPIQLGGGGLPGLGKGGSDKERGSEQNEGLRHPNDAMTRKILNDARAYIRGLAQKRGRNVSWAEQAVENAESLSAEEALKMGVIDLMAENVENLLAKLNGWKVKVLDQEIVLNTASIKIQEWKPDWKNRILATLGNPNIAYLLLLIGIYGLIIEFLHPGFILPGVAGAICLLLSLYALHVLPINYAGVALLLLGLALMVTEAFVPSFGALGIGGIISFVLGSLMMIEKTQIPGYQISRPLIASFALVSSTAFVIGISMAVRARRRKIVSGAEEMIGAIGEAMEDITSYGKVFVHSEIWEAHTETPLKKGETIRVLKRDGLALWVEPVTFKPSKEP